MIKASPRKSTLKSQSDRRSQRIMGYGCSPYGEVESNRTGLNMGAKLTPFMEKKRCWQLMENRHHRTSCRDPHLGLQFSVQQRVRTMCKGYPQTMQSYKQIQGDSRVQAHLNRGHRSSVQAYALRHPPQIVTHVCSPYMQADTNQKENLSMQRRGSPTDTDMLNHKPNQAAAETKHRVVRGNTKT